MLNHWPHTPGSLLGDPGLCCRPGLRWVHCRHSAYSVAVRVLVAGDLRAVDQFDHLVSRSHDRTQLRRCYDAQCPSESIRHVVRGVDLRSTAECRCSGFGPRGGRSPGTGRSSLVLAEGACLRCRPRANDNCCAEGWFPRLFGLGASQDLDRWRWSPTRSRAMDGESGDLR